MDTEKQKMDYFDMAIIPKLSQKGYCQCRYCYYSLAFEVCR